jgi:hypothetical protein
MDSNEDDTQKGNATDNIQRLFVLEETALFLSAASLWRLFFFRHYIPPP